MRALRLIRPGALVAIALALGGCHYYGSGGYGYRSYGYSPSYYGGGYSRHYGGHYGGYGYYGY